MRVMIKKKESQSSGRLVVNRTHLNRISWSLNFCLCSTFRSLRSRRPPGTGQELRDMTELMVEPKTDLETLTARINGACRNLLDAFVPRGNCRGENLRRARKECSQDTRALL